MYLYMKIFVARRAHFSNLTMPIFMLVKYNMLCKMCLVKIRVDRGLKPSLAPPPPVYIRELKLTGLQVYNEYLGTQDWREGSK